MTKVTFFEDFHCFEYHSRRCASQRFRYFLYAPVYESIPIVSSSSTASYCPGERTVFSSDFIPGREAREFVAGK